MSRPRSSVLYRGLGMVVGETTWQVDVGRVLRRDPGGEHGEDYEHGDQRDAN